MKISSPELQCSWAQARLTVNLCVRLTWRRRQLLCLNSFPEIGCPRKDKAVISDEKLSFFLFQESGERQPLLHRQKHIKWLWFLQQGLNQDLTIGWKKSSCWHSISNIKPQRTRKKFTCISWIQAASYLISIKFHEVPGRKYYKYCKRTDFTFIVSIKLRQVYTIAVLSPNEIFSSKII